MRKKIAALGLAAGLLLALCCACGEEETADTPAGELLETDAYSVAVPQSITAQEEVDGSVTLLLNQEKVGGITILPYENAEELWMDDSLADDTIQKKADDLLALVAPEGNVDHMLEGSASGPLSLSVIPWPEQKAPATIHYLFPKDDVLYDLYFLELEAPADVKTMMLDSFTLLS